MTTFTDAQILQIARCQKRVLWLILASILVVVASFIVRPTTLSAVFLLAGYLLIAGLGAWSVYRLAEALEETPWIYLVCAFIPYVNTATLLIMNHKATAALRKRGIFVGLMGADSYELKNLAAEAADKSEDGR